MRTRLALVTLLAGTFLVASAIAQDSDGDGLPDSTDSCPKRVYAPGFDWRKCKAMDLNPNNDTEPECKARERVAAFLASEPNHVTRIAFSIVKNGTVYFADGFSQTTNGTIQHDPTAVQRLFRIGSTSKSMASVLAKVLEEKKVLSLGDYVSDDDASKVTTNGKRTLRHLLTHQGCFKQDVGAIHLFCYPGSLTAFWKEKDDAVSPHYNSKNWGNLGGGFNYSAFNYGLAGAYLENRTGKTYGALLQTHIWDRASMCSASVDQVRANKAPIGGTIGTTRTSSMHTGPYINLVAPTDTKCSDNFYSSNDIYGKSTYSQQSYRLDECSADARDPAGGVVSSVVDMAHFARALLASYHGTSGGLLSKAGIRDLWTPTHDYGCTTNCAYQRYYATGFFVSNYDSTTPVREVEHGGARAGYNSVFVIRPQSKTAVAILVNGNVNLLQMNKVAKAILDDFDRPITGRWTDYGQGCPGTTPSQRLCLARNVSGQDLSATTGANRSYAIEVIAPSAINVRGFELYTQGGRTVTTSLLAADSKGLPGKALAIGNMTVGTQRAWYSTRFAKPVSLAKNQKFFLFFVNNATPLLASLKKGVKVPYYFKGTGSWFLGSADWTFNVNCESTGGATPKLEVIGEPAIGKQVTVRLRSAPPNSSALLLLGDSKTQWAGLALPFDMHPFGAPGCKILASGAFLIALQVNANGEALLPIAIPKQISIAGAFAYLQAAVGDSQANPFGQIVSNGGEVLIGK